MWSSKAPTILLQEYWLRIGTGRATITATWQNSPRATNANSLPTSLSKLTRLPRRLPALTFPPPILSASVWHSTFPCSTTRFSIHPIKRAILPSKHSMTPLLVSCARDRPLLYLLITVRLELDTLSEDSYKDSTLIMQLLRDNLVHIPLILQSAM